MFWRKPEKKKCHPCLTIGLCAATAIGVVIIMSKGKCMIKSKMQEITKFVKNGCKCDCECESSGQ